MVRFFVVGSSIVMFCFKFFVIKDLVEFLFKIDVVVFFEDYDYNERVIWKICCLFLENVYGLLLV